MTKSDTGGSDELVPANFRAPRRLIEALDAWAEEINQGPRWPKMKRPDLVRGVLEWAVLTRPDWERGLAEARADRSAGGGSE